MADGGRLRKELSELQKDSSSGISVVTIQEFKHLEVIQRASEVATYLVSFHFVISNNIRLPGNNQRT
jgi:hypothetical protein